jgi:plasmid stability protein
MATLQVRDMDDRIYNALKQRARSRHRSLSQEVAHIIEEYLSQPTAPSKRQSEMLLDQGRQSGITAIQEDEWPI